MIGHRKLLHATGSLLSAVFFALVFCGIALADPSDLSTSRAARLSNVVGSVQLLRGTSTEFQQALPNMPLMEGSRVVTANDGRAEIQFENGSIARITPNSSMSLNTLRRNSDGSIVTEIELLSGLGYFELRSADGQQLDAVRFGTTLLTARSNAVLRIDRDVEPVEVAVLSGDAHVASGTEFNLDIHANESIRFDGADPSRYYLGTGIGAESWDQWNSDRDEALAQAASQESVVAAEQGNPDNPAWTDLDQNGLWYSVPGYGNVWTPTGVGRGWDPYGSGHWVLYADYGYTWVSGYSWGWLPYRCGGWNYFDSFGWGWMPGTCGGYGSNYGFGSGLVFYDKPHGYIPPARPVLKGSSPRLMNMQRVIAVDRNSGIRPRAPVRIAAGTAAPQPLTYQGQRLEPISAKYAPEGGPVWGNSLRGGSRETVDSSTMGVMGTSVVQGSRSISGSETGRSGARSAQEYTILNGQTSNRPATTYQSPQSSAPGGSLPSSRPTAPQHYSAPSSAPATHMNSAPARAGGGGGHSKR